MKYWLFSLIPLLVFATFAAVPSAHARDPNGQYITLSSYYVFPQNSFTVSGHRFLPHESVILSTAWTTGTVTTDAQGSFLSPAFIVPLSMAGKGARVTARGLTSNWGDEIMMVAGGYYPTVKASRYFAAPGSAITFSGKGFAPHEPVLIDRAGASVATAQANSNGNFTALQNLPAVSTGNVSYTLRGTQSGMRVNVAITTTGAITSPASSTSFVSNSSSSITSSSDSNTNEMQRLLAQAHVMLLSLRQIIIGN